MHKVVSLFLLLPGYARHSFFTETALTIMIFYTAKTTKLVNKLYIYNSKENPNWAFLVRFSCMPIFIVIRLPKALQSYS